MNNMKYLILFLLFIPILGAAQEKNTFNTIEQATHDSIPIQFVIGDLFAPGYTTTVPGYTSTLMPFIVKDREYIIVADTTYMNIQSICEIEDGGKTRYGLIIEAVDGVASVQYVLLLPDSSNNTWEKLKNNQ